MRKLIAIVVAVSTASPAFAKHICRAPAPEVGSDLLGVAVIAAFGLAWFAWRNFDAFKAGNLMHSRPAS